MGSREELVRALCEGDREHLLDVATEDVRVFAPFDGVASPGRVDAEGRRTLRAALTALASWGGESLGLVSQAHDGPHSVVELVSRADGRPVTVVVAWQAEHVREIKWYLVPEGDP